MSERADAWEAGVTPTPHDPAAADWATVTDAIDTGSGAASECSWNAEDEFEAARIALARLRARDQARTDALIEAAWSYRQKADELEVYDATLAAVHRMAADTLTRIAAGKEPC